MTRRVWPSTTIRAWDLDAVQTPRWILCPHEVSGRNSDVVLDREAQHGHGAGRPVRVNDPI
jgi:hypothetical protein